MCNKISFVSYCHFQIPVNCFVLQHLLYLFGFTHFTLKMISQTYFIWLFGGSNTSSRIVLDVLLAALVAYANGAVLPHGKLSLWLNICILFIFISSVYLTDRFIHSLYSFISFLHKTATGTRSAASCSFFWSSVLTFAVHTSNVSHLL